MDKMDGAIKSASATELWAELVGQVAENSELALARLYDGTSRMVYGMALRILGDPSAAEDITMEVYLQVWRTACSYDPGRGTVLSWLATVVRSRAIDCLRARKARRAELEDNVYEVAELHDSRPDPELASVNAGQAHLLRTAMGALSRDQREAIELAYFSGLSHSEVAERTGLPLGTVKTRIRMGMISLRESLQPYRQALL